LDALVPRRGSRYGRTERSRLLVWQQGQVGIAGARFDQLNAPYDATLTGNFTGLTPHER
jgi:hypothetical protein